MSERKTVGNGAWFVMAEDTPPPQTWQQTDARRR